MSADGTGESQAGPPLPLIRRVSAPAGSGEWALQEQSKQGSGSGSTTKSAGAGTSKAAAPPQPPTSKAEAKALAKLKWNPKTTTLEQLIKEMVEADIARVENPSLRI